MTRQTIVLLFLCGLIPAAGAQPAPATLLRQSIAYHDPDGVWAAHTHRFTLQEARPDGKTRTTRFVLDHPAGSFALYVERDGHVIEAHHRGTDCTATLDGVSDIPDDLREQYRLSCDGLAWWHAYYGYVHALPMNLTDPGTNLAPEVTRTTFAERPVYALRVTYDADVGSDTWYFYFDPETSALVGSRFYHDEAANDGEYLVFEGEVVHDGIRLPKTMRWYVNADGRFLGADTVVAYAHEGGQ